MNKRIEHTEPDGLAKMREPFPPHQISKMCRSTKKDNPKGTCKKCGGWHGLPAIQLDYVGHAALTDRLLDADPAWSWEPMATGPDGYPVIDGNGGLWIKLTVCGVTRYGYGDAQGKVGGDAMKERIGDALRNAAMRFGAALDLWHKGDLHIEDDEPKKESAKSIASSDFDKLTPEKQKEYLSAAADIIESFGSESPDVAYDYYLQFKSDLDDAAEQAAWRGCFPSNIRTAFQKIYTKRQSETMATQS